MQFDRRGLHLLEPSRKDLFQGILDREGTAILDDDAAKLREGASRRHAEHADHQRLQKPTRRLAHEHGERPFGQLVVEGLVVHGIAKERIESPLQIGQAFHLRPRKQGHQRHDHSIRSELPHPMTVAGPLAQLIEQAFGEGLLELRRERTDFLSFHPPLPDHLDLPIKVDQIGWSPESSRS